jgi:hypothetical protein
MIIVKQNLAPLLTACSATILAMMSASATAARPRELSFWISALSSLLSFAAAIRHAPMTNERRNISLHPSQRRDLASSP